MTNIRWNTVGSALYETLKFGHHLALLKIIGASTYGIVGSTFSILFLTIYLADAESVPSLLPYLTIITAHKNRFLRFFPAYFLINGTLLCIGATIATWLHYYYLFPTISLPAFIFFFTIISEGMRSFLRHFLHTTFVNKPTVIIDLCTTLSYFAGVWIPTLLWSKELTITRIFLPLLASSWGAVLGFLFLAYRFYTTLPNNTDVLQEPSLAYQITKTRIGAFLVHISKHLFSGNFLVPFFALKFGLEYAGLLKIASYLANSIKAIVKTAVGFSTSALLAHLKHQSLPVKRKLFTILYKTFNSITYPIAIFTLFNYKTVLSWVQTTKTLYQPAFILSLFLLFIAFIELFFLIYEEFYLVEEALSPLLLLKFFEVTLFSIFILTATHGITKTLLSIVFLRIMCFIVLTSDAYIRWKIQPNIQINRSLFVGTFLFSLLFSLL